MLAKINGKADAWRKHIATQQVSGQSVRAWCRQNDCAEHAFYWWRARLGLSSAKRRPGKQLAFAQVVVQPSAAEPAKSPAYGPARTDSSGVDAAGANGEADPRP